MSEIIVRKRQGGKTTELIRLAAENFAYIVCLNQREAQRVAEEARKAGLDIPFPLTLEEFFGGNFYSRGIKGFLFDNLDMMLERLAHGVPVIAATWTEKD